MTKFEDVFSEEIWATTYKDYKDNTIDDNFLRVANAISSVELTDELKKLWCKRFYEMLQEFKIVPGGRILSNAGTEWNGTTLINCYVAPQQSKDIDSISSIYKTLEEQALTLKSEGGWGNNFSYLRPRGSFIHGVGVESPGAVKFMELYDKSSEIVTSGSGLEKKNIRTKGKIRKGAMLAALDCNHPDIIEFITAKQIPGRLTKFNISVNCTDKFMNKLLSVLQAEENNEPKEIIDELDKWDLIFPDTKFNKYRTEWDGNIEKWLSKNYPVEIYNTISIRWLWNLIMESTYNRAEPGVLFLDKANYLNPLNYVETIQATNPCGEQILAPGGICCLGSINLTQFIDEKNNTFDLKKIRKYLSYLVRFLDNVNSYSNVPLPQYKYNMENKRRIGCGIMGLGSALTMLKIPYDSPEALDLCNELMISFSKFAHEASINLAEEKGMFKLCNPEKHAESPFFKQINLPASLIEKMKKVGIRNSSLLSIQPTGNTSILANIISGGIEPIFQTEYIRTVIINKIPEEMVEVTPRWTEGEFYETKLFKFVKEGDETILRGKFNGVVYKIDKNRGLTKEMFCEDFSTRYLKNKKEWRSNAKFIRTTNNLSASSHLDMLSCFAKYVDSAISKTINLPNDYPFDDFKKIYLDAYKTGIIKGLTTYRSGTMATVLSAKDEKYINGIEEEIILDTVKLPDISPATMKVIRAEGKKWYLTVILNEQQTRPFALFAYTNSHEKNVTTTDVIEKLLKLAETKGIPKKYIESTEQKIQGENNVGKICRLISLNLRHGVLIKNIVYELGKVQDVFVGTFVFQIKKFLASFIKDGDKAEGKQCLECSGYNIIYSEGCLKCADCGHSKCS